MACNSVGKGDGRPLHWCARAAWLTLGLLPSVEVLQDGFLTASSMSLLDYSVIMVYRFARLRGIASE